HDHGGDVAYPGRLLHVLGVVLDVGHVREAYGRAIPVRDHEAPVVVAREELVVGVDRVGLLAALEVALRLVHVRLRDGGTDILQAEVVGGEGSGVGLDAHRRLLPTAQAHEAHPGKLRDLLRQARVGEVLHARQRQGVGRQPEGEDRAVGGVGFVVTGGVGRSRRRYGGGWVEVGWTSFSAWWLF